MKKKFLPFLNSVEDDDFDTLINSILDFSPIINNYQVALLIIALKEYSFEEVKTSIDNLEKEEELSLYINNLSYFIDRRAYEYFFVYYPELTVYEITTLVFYAYFDELSKDDKYYSLATLSVSKLPFDIYITDDPSYTKFPLQKPDTLISDIISSDKKTLIYYYES